jgi:predicted DNA-binding transcriptional regulator AlpA
MPPTATQTPTTLHSQHLAAVGQITASFRYCAGVIACGPTMTKHTTPPLDFAGAYPFKAKLLSNAEREAIVRHYGEVVASQVDKVVAARGDRIIDGFAKTMGVLANSLKPDDTSQRLLSHPEAATMLGVSVATVKRLVQDGRLPQPVKISEHRIGHRIDDLKAFCTSIAKPPQT